MSKDKSNQIEKNTDNSQGDINITNTYTTVNIDTSFAMKVIVSVVIVVFMLPWGTEDLKLKILELLSNFFK